MREATHIVEENTMCRFEQKKNWEVFSGYEWSH
jgi:hypothetical protein